MRRVEIAHRFALAAKEAERLGKHRRAAELYAEALRVLEYAPASTQLERFGEPEEPVEPPAREAASHTAPTASGNVEEGRSSTEPASPDEQTPPLRASAPRPNTMIRRKLPSSGERSALFSESRAPGPRTGRS